MRRLIRGAYRNRTVRLAIAIMLTSWLYTALFDAPIPSAGVAILGVIVGVLIIYFRFNTVKEVRDMGATQPMPTYKGKNK